jgi:2-oxoglutarate ferredoxin oxidoreductase subunit gamma
MRKEIRISGFGGQGVVLAGYIMGKALSLYQDLEAVMTQSYGPEARGGASSANIVVADRPIDYPFIQKADVLVALSQEGYTRFRPEALEDALVLIDENLVNPLPEDPVREVPATSIAEVLGRRIVANMVMLGFVASNLDLIDRDALVKSIETSVRKDTITLNLQAFESGYEYSPIKETSI